MSPPGTDLSQPASTDCSRWRSAPPSLRPDWEDDGSGRLLRDPQKQEVRLFSSNLNLPLTSSLCGPPTSTFTSTSAHRPPATVSAQRRPPFYKPGHTTHRIAPHRTASQPLPITPILPLHRANTPAPSAAPIASLRVESPSQDTIHPRLRCEAPRLIRPNIVSEAGSSSPIARVHPSIDPSRHRCTARDVCHPLRNLAPQGCALSDGCSAPFHLVVAARQRTDPSGNASFVSHGPASTLLAPAFAPFHQEGATQHAEEWFPFRDPTYPFSPPFATSVCWV